MNKVLLVALAIFFASSINASSNKLRSVSIMTYNLENLFDTKHDAGKKDWTYLPLKTKRSSKQAQAYCHSLSNEYYKKSCLELDWSDEILNKKITNLSRVLSTYENGKGADIVVFQEVENLSVLSMLVNKGLTKLGYKYITLLEGKDSRGIDVGMISRYPIRKQKIHHLDLAPYSKRNTRPILEVVFEVGKKSVTVFGNHWPSQANSDETRMKASMALREVSLLSNSDLVIATGDFNTSSDDLLNGIETNLLPIYEDVEVKGRLFGNVEAKGTHWYKGRWESLDKIFILKRTLFSSSARVNYFSFDIIKKNFMIKNIEWTDFDTNRTYQATGIPFRFDKVSGQGYSDHLPVAVEFDL